MKIVANTTDLGEYASVDCYQKYPGDGVEDALVENYNVEHETDFNNDSFDFDYDSQKVVEGLGKKMAEQLEALPLIKKATFIKAHQPKFYNYVGDSADIELEFDEKELEAFIEKRMSEFVNFVHTSAWNSTVASKEGEEKEFCKTLAKLNFYVDKDYPEVHGKFEDYTMHETAWTLWEENTIITLRKDD